MSSVTLNDKQQEGVYCTEGPLLLLAGAGSGKTRVITHRIAYLIEEKQVNPYNILAITFTNKAAGEMRERVDKIVGIGAESVWVSTFHSMCVRILRRYIDRIGYSTNFSIYDTDDQKTVIKECRKTLDLDPKMYSEKMLISAISKAKEQYISPYEYDTLAQGDYRKMQTAKVYHEYQNTLKKNNALDFDDLLYKTVDLFNVDREVLEAYQSRFKYIMVDEYQDTNHIQFLLIKQLADKYKNLCVVGDDDQSIYKFRGANIYNILNFEREYDNATVIKLEQNYRSTGNILAAANEVIKNNEGRKEKKLWTEQDAGDKVIFKQYDTEYVEADGMVREIVRLTGEENYEYNDIAILYRTNAQSRIIEEKLIVRNIPYKIVGGVNFYSRREVKDLICYLKVIENGHDDVAVKRVVNVPKRGIGAASINKLQMYADSVGVDILDAMYEAEAVPGLGKTAKKLEEFTNLISDMRDILKKGNSIEIMFDELLEKTGYVNLLIDEGTEEAAARLDNISELKNKIVKYEEENENPTLGELLEEIALVADIDSLDEEDNRVILMTLHSAKGLEFPCVFMGGMEDRLFPSAMSMNSEDEDGLEEERRLCYVGITRAMERLYLSAARTRMINGSTNANPISRFVKEIPEELLEMDNKSKDVARRPVMPINLEAGTGFTGKPYIGKEIVINKSTNLNYSVGDTVEHAKFGIGEVTDIKMGGKDYEVTVDFQKVGPKKMFASFAKLKKL